MGWSFRFQQNRREHRAEKRFQTGAQNPIGCSLIGRFAYTECDLIEIRKRAWENLTYDDKAANPMQPATMKKKR